MHQAEAMEVRLRHLNQFLTCVDPDINMVEATPEMIDRVRACVRKSEEAFKNEVLLLEQFTLPQFKDSLCLKL